MTHSNLQQRLRYTELVFAMSNPINHIETTYKPWTGQQDRPAFVKVAKYKPAPKSKKRSR